MKLSIPVEPPVPPLPPSSIGPPLISARPIPKAALVVLISSETLKERELYEEINKIIMMLILFLSLVALALIILWIYKSLHEPVARHAERGMMEKEIELFPLFPYSTAESRALLDEGDDGDTHCTICIMDYEDEEVIRTLPCNHYYHAKCIDTWLKDNRTCPLCIRDLHHRQAYLQGGQMEESSSSSVTPASES